MPDAGRSGIAECPNEIEALVERCRQGGLGAVTAVCARFQDRLYDLACAIVHDGAGAEDAVQDTFLRVFQHIDRYWDSYRGRIVRAVVLALQGEDVEQALRQVQDQGEE